MQQRERRVSIIAGVLALTVGLAACGGTDTTTVIREAPVETIERTATVERAPAPVDREGSAPRSEPPNVLGLPLPEARRMLERTGYRTVAKNTDTTFGIILPDNYTVCNQGKPRGDIVVVLAQKYGC